MGEGAGVLVIEALQLPGAGAHTDRGTDGLRYDRRRLSRDRGTRRRRGAARAMRLALGQAGLAPADIQHLNAHSTSTPVGDQGEIAAIRSVFGRPGDRRSAPPSRRPDTCWAPPADWKRSSPSWRCATRWRRRPSTSKRPIPPPTASTWSAARPGGLPWSTRSRTGSDSAASMRASFFADGHRNPAFSDSGLAYTHQPHPASIAPRWA